MSIYSVVKNHIITKYPNVIAEYSEWIIAHGNSTFIGRLRAYTHLFKLLLTKKSGKKKINKSEFEDSKRKNVVSLIGKLNEYDVISFDVFDTLVLRNVEKPEDVFEAVGYKLGIEGFAPARKCVEKNLADTGNYTIYDIYSHLEKQRGIKAECFNIEFEVEKLLCRDNPYIKEVYEAALKYGKKVIAVSDMYWPKEYIEEILCKCGYTEIKDIYVSCDYGCSKKDGTLFKLLKEQEYQKQRIFHIGDNYNSDIVQAKKNGITATQYISVYERGKKYRHNEFGKQTLGQSIANAIINNEIHNGISEMNQYEQFGYIYGGPIVAGYCKYINEIVEEKSIDKILFLARDASVIHKAYNNFYLKCENEYIYVSRNAVAQLAFERYPDYFIEQVLQLRFVDSPLNQSIEMVFIQTGLQCLLDKLEEVGLSKDSIFKQKEMQQVSSLIYKYKDLITEAFASVRMAAELYWKNVIGNAQRIALVDIGWQASTMMCMDYFLNEVCDMHIDLCTIHLGTIKTKWNAIMIEKGRVFSYCFADDCNKDIGDAVMYQPVRKAVIEILFTAFHPTLISYKIGENEQGLPVFADVIDKNYEINIKVQEGILNFVEKMNYIKNDLRMEVLIQGDRVFRNLCDVSSQKRYIKYLFQDYRFSNVPCDVHEEKMEDIIRRNK